jgi:hypothetical protein
MEREKAAIQLPIGDVDRVLAVFGYEGNPADLRPKRSNPRLLKRMELSRSIKGSTRTA